MQKIETTFTKLFPQHSLETVYFPDHDDRVALVHYSSRKEAVAGLRGVVVDLETESVVCDSLDIGPQTKVTRLYPQSRLHFDNGEQVTINFDDPAVKVREGLNGAVVRVFKRGDKVYKASHKRLDIKDVSSFNIKLDEIWDKLGPMDHELFPEEESDSDVVYYFFIAANLSGIDSLVQYPQIKLMKILNKEKAIWSPTEQFQFEYMNWRTAAGKVISSYIPGLPYDTLGLGGFLIVEIGDRTYRLHSKSFAHREFCRGDNFNAFEAFVDLCGFANPKLLERFKANFAPIVPIRANEEAYPRLDGKWRSTYRLITDEAELNYTMRIRIIHTHFMLALEPSVRFYARKFVKEFFRMKKEVSEAILKYAVKVAHFPTLSESTKQVKGKKNSSKKAETIEEQKTSVEDQEAVKKRTDMFEEICASILKSGTPDSKISQKEAVLDALDKEPSYKLKHLAKAIGFTSSL